MPAPAATSPIATILVTTSGYIYPILSNHVTIFSGGNGNLPSPCKINEVPKPSLNNQGAIGKNGFAKILEDYSY